MERPVIRVVERRPRLDVVCIEVANTCRMVSPVVRTNGIAMGDHSSLCARYRIVLEEDARGAVHIKGRALP
jgi:hypothetical protein